MTNPEFAKTLTQLRKSLRLYQKEVAALLGVPLSTYQGWECEKHLPAKVCLECVLKKIKENQPTK